MPRRAEAIADVICKGFCWVFGSFFYRRLSTWISEAAIYGMIFYLPLLDTRILCQLFFIHDVYLWLHRLGVSMLRLGRRKLKKLICLVLIGILHLSSNVLIDSCTFFILFQNPMLCISRTILYDVNPNSKKWSFLNK